MADDAAKKKAEDEAAAKAAAEKKAEDEAAAKAAAKPMKVTFLKSHALYNKGEVATFPASKAGWMIKQKIAVKA